MERDSGGTGEDSGIVAPREFACNLLQRSVAPKKMHTHWYQYQFFRVIVMRSGASFFSELA